MNWKRFSMLGCAAAVLAGCGEQPEARVYTIPKEANEAPSAGAPPMMGGGNDSMANRSLPDEFLNQNAVAPAWDVPASWERADGSSMRLASFAVQDGEAALDIAVTTFPGDVGGLLANVNRWRGQIDLPPTTQGEVEQAVEILPTRSGDATYVELSNGTTATLAAILMHDQASWFIKMTGPAALVRRETENFRAFVASTDFAATHNH